MKTKIRRKTTVRRPRLATVLKYNNKAIVERYEDKLELSEKDAEQLFEDVKTFLWLANLEGAISPPPRIDDGWHEFLMFTEDYAIFCKKYFGRMIHHRPRRRSDSPDHGASLKMGLDAAKKHLGQNLSENWSQRRRQGVRPAQVSTELDTNCTECGTSFPHMLHDEKPSIEFSECGSGPGR